MPRQEHRWHFFGEPSSYSLTGLWRASDPGKVIEDPAKSLRGALEKLKIVETAYGTRDGLGDLTLEANQDHGGLALEISMYL